MHNILSFLSIIAFFFVGDFSVSGYKLAYILLPSVFLWNIYCRNYGSKQSLRLALIISILIFVLLSPAYFFNSHQGITYVYFLFLTTPFVFWSFLNFPFLHFYSTRVSYLLSWLTSLLIFIVAGPNVAYRISVAFLLFTFFPTSSRASSNNFLSSLPFFILSFATNSKFAIILSFIILAIFLLSRFFRTIYTLYSKLSISKYSLYLLLSVGSILTLSAYFLLTYSRIGEIYSILFEFDSFSLISESARNRADWYSYFFKPVSSLTHHSFFGSSEPLWGYYPHNLFLDSLGHFGILYFAFVVFFLSF